MEAIDFYNANATNIVNVDGPRTVRRVMEAQCFAKDAQVMSLADACQFAELYAAALAEEELKP